MDDEFRQRIIADIEKSGIPLEIATVKKMRERRWLAIPSLHFQDADGDLHELDVYGSFIQTEEDSQSYFPPGLELVIECKRSINKTWVFFEDNVEIVFVKDIFHKLRILADLPTMRSWSVSVGETGQIFAKHHYADESIPRAHAHLEAFKGHRGESDIFAAFRGIWYAQDCVKRWFHSRSEAGDSRKRVNLLHGAVVFDGTLVLATHAANGQWDVREVNHVLARTVDAVTKPTSSPLTEDNEVVIDVLHASYLSAYLKTCEQDLAAFCEYLRPRHTSL
jgi:hypothetical protein